MLKTFAVALLSAAALAHFAPLDELWTAPALHEPSAYPYEGWIWGANLPAAEN